MKKKLILIILIMLMILLMCNCATTRQAQINRQRQSMMLMDNTDLHINRKYYQQKYHKTKRVKYYKNKNNYKKK